MANWTFTAWTGGPSTALAAASAVAISSASAISFGGGTRGQFQQNISLNTWNTAMHLAEDTSSSSVDGCDDNHLWPITPWNAGDFGAVGDTGCVLDGVYINMTGASPIHSRGLGLGFDHDTTVNVSPVQVWAGTALTVQTDPQSCYIAMCDLTSADPTWSTVKPSAKLTLRPHGDTAATVHNWSVGIALEPLAVGHNGENVMKVECTFF